MYIVIFKQGLPYDPNMMCQKFCDITNSLGGVIVSTDIQTDRQTN